jgi:hypothetical protein
MRDMGQRRRRQSVGQHEVMPSLPVDVAQIGDFGGEMSRPSTLTTISS